MKHIYISLFLVSVLVGCTTVPPQTKHYTPTRGIAYQALELEGAHWDCTESVNILDSLVENVSCEIISSPYEVESHKTLEIIHRTVIDEGFKIVALGVTFGSGLTNRTLDCSDLTFIYLEVLERFDAKPCVAFTRNHITIVLRKGGLSSNTNEAGLKSVLLWETTTGKKSKRRIFEESADVPLGSITNSVYLTPLPSKLALSAAYIEIAQKLSQENQYAAAEACYRKALEVHPRFVTGLQSLAAFLVHRGRYAEAEPFLFKAIALDRTNPTLYDFASAFYAQIGNRERAIQMYERLVSVEEKLLNKRSVGKHPAFSRK
jgi:hypothetical protein